MRIKLPDLEGREMLDYLVTNKKRLIAQKCSMEIKSDPVAFGALPVKIAGAEKSENPDVDPDTVRVKVVCNTALFMDTYGDVLAPDCWSKSITERGPKGKGIIPHLKNHEHKCESQIGDAVDLFSEMVSLESLGYPGADQAQALIMVSDVKKEYCEKLYSLYKKGRIKQHSIGMQYVKLQLAINNEDYKEEFAVWTSHYDQIINKEEADRRGYFWWVPEIKLYENSAVLFGANELTPTLMIEESQPEKSTGKNDTSTGESQPDHLTSKQVTTRILLTNFFKQ